MLARNYRVPSCHGQRKELRDSRHRRPKRDGGPGLACPPDDRLRPIRRHVTVVRPQRGRIRGRLWTRAGLRPNVVRPGRIHFRNAHANVLRGRGSFLPPGALCGLHTDRRRIQRRVLSRQVELRRVGRIANRGGIYAGGGIPRWDEDCGAGVPRGPRSAFGRFGGRVDVGNGVSLVGPRGRRFVRPAVRRDNRGRVDTGLSGGCPHGTCDDPPSGRTWRGVPWQSFGLLLKWWRA
mmetsp:Transcript_33013/g.69273  ORF Transcript_33013/g.69273 Transcript_33013/m.69273 type:complete len:235 (-) Transcript_33013:1004-1708(-)